VFLSALEVADGTICDGSGDPIDLVLHPLPMLTGLGNPLPQNPFRNRTLDLGSGVIPNKLLNIY
jgi:hypothetical protein